MYTHVSYPLDANALTNSGISNLQYHLATGDYFFLLATILGFSEEALKNCHCNPTAVLAEEELELLSQMHRDLLYLQQNYRIVSKYIGPEIDAS
jgi:hypothetical protein